MKISKCEIPILDFNQHLGLDIFNPERAEPP
jgi:hypothetical protein